MTQKLLMGNEAFAHAALEAGVRVVAGYPGTPSSEVIETIAKLRAQGVAHDVHVEWSTNEKAALELVAGAAYCGARTLFTCKQVGLNVASDALMSLNYVGVRGGTVLFVADDPGPISSQTEQDTRRSAAFAKVPVLDPASVEQGFAMMRAAFELSERYGTPVIVRPTTRVCHASAFIDVADETRAHALPEGGFQKGPEWVIFPKRAYEAHGEINDRLRAIADDYVTDPVLAQFNEHAEGGSLASGASAGEDEAAAQSPFAIVAGGVSAAYVREALSLIEREAEAVGTQVPPYRFLQVGTAYPFPEQEVVRFLEGAQDVMVFEELDSVIEDGILQVAGRHGLQLRVHGKHDGSTLERGENSTRQIVFDLARYFRRAHGGHPVMPILEAAIGRLELLHYDEPLPVRPPVLCAGCPHRGSFYAVKRALGKQDAVLCGDIGCYTLGNAMPLDAVDTCLCMGAGITMAQGFAVAEPQKKCVAFVGDSTFFASAMTGIANAAYNGHDITVCLLDNATTAMTGGQPHPGTGITLMGQQSKPIDSDAVLRALGIEHIVHANPFDPHEATEAARSAIGFEGPSALVLKAPCIQLAPPKPPVAISNEACTGCKKCIASVGCPAIGFDGEAAGPASKGRGTAFVDESLCYGCGLCVPLCPFGAIQGEGEDA